MCGLGYGTTVVPACLYCHGVVAASVVMVGFIVTTTSVVMAGPVVVLASPVMACPVLSWSPLLCSYGSMTILASRDHTCINPEVADSSNRSEECTQLLRNPHVRLLCGFYLCVCLHCVCVCVFFFPYACICICVYVYLREFVCALLCVYVCVLCIHLK